MATIQISAELTPEKILEAVKQFTPEELDEFTLQLHTIRAQQTTPHLSQRETELLKKVNAGVPQEILRPLQQAQAKLEAGTITAEEHKELLRLVDTVETYEAERLTWLIELAQLQKQTVPQLIETLGLQPKYAD